MHRAIITLSVLAAAGLAVGLVGGQPQPAAGPVTTTAPATDQSAAVRQTVAAYCNAFNKGDIQSVTAFWRPMPNTPTKLGPPPRGVLQSAGCSDSFSPITKAPK